MIYSVTTLLQNHLTCITHLSPISMLRFANKKWCGTRILPPPLVSSCAIWDNLVNITELICLLCTIELIVSTLKELLGNLYNGTWKVATQNVAPWWLSIEVSHVFLLSRPDPLYKSLH